ncbi:Lateral flagellin, partial [Vibrio parahaemolyticus]|nr:Lateral flagellin [Vibrio parahaemolyticus]
DDAAGLQIANRLEAQTRGMNVAMRNAQDGISMMQTAEGAMDEMTNITYRMKDLATQSINGTNSQQDRAAMDAEFKQLKAELTN